MDSMQQGKERMHLFRERLDQLVELITGPDASLRQRTRATAAILAVGGVCMFRAQSAPQDELRVIALELADDLTRLAPALDPSRAGSPRHEAAGKYRTACVGR